MVILSVLVGGVRCLEKSWESPTVSYSRFSDPSGGRVLECDWDMAETVRNALLGNGDDSKHPLAPYLVCNDLSISGRGKGELYAAGGEFPEPNPTPAASKYPRATIVATYGPRRQAGQSKVAEERISFSGEALIIPGSAYEWNVKLNGGDSTVKGQTLAEQDVGIITTTGERELVMPRVIGFTIAANEGFLGKVNEAEWDGFAAGTLLFDGYTAERIYIPAEANAELAAHRITYRFKYRYPPWNFIWSPQDATWVNTTPPIYESTTFVAG